MRVVVSGFSRTFIERTGCDEHRTSKTCGDPSGHRLRDSSNAGMSQRRRARRRRGPRATLRRLKFVCRPEVGGRVVELRVAEGDRIEVGGLVARLSTTDAELNVRRAEAERDQAIAQLRLVEAGARPEEVRQAQAQLDTAEADARAAAAELQSAEADVQRFEALLTANAGSRKQRDDAVTRRDVASRAGGGGARPRPRGRRGARQSEVRRAERGDCGGAGPGSRCRGADRIAEKRAWPTRC